MSTVANSSGYCWHHRRAGRATAALSDSALFSNATDCSRLGKLAESPSDRFVDVLVQPCPLMSEVGLTRLHQWYPAERRNHGRDHQCSQSSRQGSGAFA